MIVQVQKGNTLTSIAASYHTTPQAIRAQNHLQDDLLWEGMRLWVQGYVYRVLQDGETVETLCDSLCVSPQNATLLPDGKFVKISV